MKPKHLAILGAILAGGFTEAAAQYPDAGIMLAAAAALAGAVIGYLRGRE